jgi:hypothetical protein
MRRKLPEHKAEASLRTPTARTNATADHEHVHDHVNVHVDVARGRGRGRFFHLPTASVRSFPASLLIRRSVFAP